ncbi:MAG: hypothetical protein ACK5NY_00875 [Burkholderiaceae bacterium]|jgi:hypothetical protein
MSINMVSVSHGLAMPFVAVSENIFDKPMAAAFRLVKQYKQNRETFKKTAKILEGALRQTEERKNVLISNPGFIDRAEKLEGLQSDIDLLKKQIKLYESKINAVKNFALGTVAAVSAGLMFSLGAVAAVLALPAAPVIAPVAFAGGFALAGYALHKYDSVSNPFKNFDEPFALDNANLKYQVKCDGHDVGSTSTDLEEGQKQQQMREKYPDYYPSLL